ncbi:jg21613 [Pararge aegeria aegeria]|uniref:Jg21613 protein n=1 Tax=Pararge aegeria aegeria TaxID=348720 RepID=A0A8S4QQX3_9NEOP|nr:jg21613 [Pararge aegeria aegeria]
MLLGNVIKHSSYFPRLVSVLGRPEPSVVRMATGTAPRWVTPASRAHSRSLAGCPGRQVLQGVMLGSQGMLRIGAIHGYSVLNDKTVDHRNRLGNRLIVPKIQPLPFINKERFAARPCVSLP